VVFCARFWRNNSTKKLFPLSRIISPMVSTWIILKTLLESTLVVAFPCKWSFAPAFGAITPQKNPFSTF